MSLKFAAVALGVAALVGGAAAALSAEPAQGPAGKPAIKNETMPYTAATDGKTMYAEYCAACHGAAGKGDGPAAAALKTRPADLSMLAKDNKGAFPAEKVAQVLRHGVAVPAHGTSDMPTWGPGLRQISGGSDAVVTMRIANLSDYLKGLQAK